MRLIEYRFVGEDHPRYLIAECDEADTCLGCGAPYQTGPASCGHCLRPVGAKEADFLKCPIRLL